MYNIYYPIKLKSTSTKTQNILFTCIHQVESTHQWLRLRNRRVSSFIRGVRISPSYGFFVKKKIPRVLPYYSSLFIFFFFFTLPRFLSVVTEIYVSMGRHRVRAFIIDQENVVCDAVSERCFRNSK